MAKYTTYNESVFAALDEQDSEDKHKERALEHVKLLNLQAITIINDKHKVECSVLTSKSEAEKLATITNNNQGIQILIKSQQGQDKSSIDDDNNLLDFKHILEKSIFKLLMNLCT
jgi:hypothetical protein